MSGLPRVLALAWLACGSQAARAEPELAPFEAARRLAELGPRVPGTAAHARAQELLLGSLAALRLERVGRTIGAAAGSQNLEGALRGGGEHEIVLAAHYDSRTGSPGAADDASGCAVVLGALQELARTPLRTTVRAVFFDGEERGLSGSRAWLGRLEEPDRQRLLAAVHLDVVGLRRGGRPTILGLPTFEDGARRTRSPAWLVHATLRAGEAAGFRFHPADPFHPFAGQLLLRTVATPYRSDVVSFLGAGIPSVLLTDFSLFRPYRALHTQQDVLARLDAERLQRWVAAVSALVRRLDALEGRPLWEEDYLVWAGRVWIRRDLVWVGFLLWVALVFRARPGRWAGAGADERRSRGRAYLPGYLFRFSLLGLVFWMPALGAALVYPAALAGLWEPRSRTGRWVLQGALLLPVSLWLVLILWAAIRGTAVAYELSPMKTALLATVLATLSWQVWTPRTPEPAAVTSPGD